MKKRVMTMAAACAIALGSWAQYGEAIQFPTADLYDSGMMNGLTRAYAETYGMRQRIFNEYVEMAFQAWENKHWSKVVRYVDGALDTGLWSEDLYYMRGFAYEQMGNVKAAKKNYKEGKRLGSYEAAKALENLLQRERQYRNKK